jgi:hypothetical protein
MKKLKYLFTIMCIFISTPTLISAKHSHVYVRGANGITESFYVHPTKRIIELKNEIARKFHIDQSTHKIILRHNGHAIFSDESIIETYPYIYDEGLDFVVTPIAPIIEDEGMMIEERIRPQRKFWREGKREIIESREFRGRHELRRRR